MRTGYGSVDSPDARRRVAMARLPRRPPHPTQGVAAVGRRGVAVVAAGAPRRPPPSWTSGWGAGARPGTVRSPTVADASSDPDARRRQASVARSFTLSRDRLPADGQEFEGFSAVA